MSPPRRRALVACAAAVLAVCMAPSGAAADVLELPDGSILATQRVSSSADGGGRTTVLAKYTPAGHLDTSFSEDGVLWGLAGTVLAPGAGGRVVVAGLEHTTEGGDAEQPFREVFSLVLERFDAGGRPDATFGDRGRVVTRFEANVRPYGALVGDDGSLLVGGVTADDLGYDVGAFVARYAPDGKLDSGFGEGGIAVSAPFEGEEALLVSDGSLVAVDGRLVVTADRYAVRFGADGTVDTSVGEGGVLRLTPADPESGDPVGTLATPVDGGYAWLEAEPDSTAFGPVRRADAAGTDDAEWGDGGAARVDVAAGGPEGIGALAEDAEGRVLAAGSVGDDVGLARLTPGGAPDAQFGGDGGVLLGLARAGGLADDVAAAAGGGVIAGGAIDAGEAGRDLLVARYTEAGQPDQDFGTNGVVVTHFEDTSPPEISITSSPPAGGLGAGGEFAFASPEATVAFECRLDAGPWAACASPVRYEGIAEGNHTFHLRGTDAAGNAREAWRAWVVNHAAPDGTLVAAPPPRTASSRARFEFRSSDPDSTFRCRLDTGRGQPCESPFEFGGLSDGGHELEIRAIDGFGATDPEPILYRWTVDSRVADPGARPPQVAPPLTIVPPPLVAVRPTLKLSRPALRSRAVRLRVTSDVAARIRVTGRLGRRGQRRGGIRLRTARRTAAAGRTITVRVRLGRKALKRLSRATRPLVARLTITATADSGGKTVRRMRLKISPPSARGG